MSSLKPHSNYKTISFSNCKIEKSSPRAPLYYRIRAFLLERSTSSPTRPWVNYKMRASPDSKTELKNCL